MKQYEFIRVSIHKKEKHKTIWVIRDGESEKYLEIEIGRDEMDIAVLHVLNKLGREGWSLGTKITHQYVIYMQREITVFISPETASLHYEETVK